MAAFRFLHAADLHLGSPFRGLAIRDPIVAGRFAEATRAAFVEMISRAILESVDFVVIAGDIYDGAWKDNSIGLFFNREIARLDRAGIPLYLLRGNHDAESVVTGGISLPASAHVFGTRRPVSFHIERLRVALHGQGFAERATVANLALGYPPPVAGWFNIGVLHTSLTGRPPHEPYAPCSVADLRSRNYDYWALGHVHQHEIVSMDPPIVYPGNAQGRDIRETGAKGAVLVTVEDGQVSIGHLACDVARWAMLEVDLTGIDRLELVPLAVERAIQPEPGRLLAIRVRLIGQTPVRRAILADRAGLADEIAAGCHRIDPDIWIEKLEIRLDDPVATVATDGGSFDIDAALRSILAAPETAATAEAITAEIASQLPGGLATDGTPLGDPVATLMDEARELLLARLGWTG